MVVVSSAPCVRGDVSCTEVRSLKLQCSPTRAPHKPSDEKHISRYYRFHCTVFSPLPSPSLPSTASPNPSSFYPHPGPSHSTPSCPILSTRTSSLFPPPPQPYTTHIIHITLHPNNYNTAASPASTPLRFQQHPPHSQKSTCTKGNIRYAAHTHSHPKKRRTDPPIR